MLSPYVHIQQLYSTVGISSLKNGRLSAGLAVRWGRPQLSRMSQRKQPAIFSSKKPATGATLADSALALAAASVRCPPALASTAIVSRDNLRWHILNGIIVFDNWILFSDL